MPACDPGGEVPVGFLPRSAPALPVGGVQQEGPDGDSPEAAGAIPPAAWEGP